MLVEPTFWLYTAGNVTLNKMLADFHINIKSKCWKFEEFTSLRVESCFFLVICERQSMSPGDGFEILTLRYFVGGCGFLGTCFTFNTFWVMSQIH